MDIRENSLLLKGSAILKGINDSGSVGDVVVRAIRPACLARSLVSCLAAFSCLIKKKRGHDVQRPRNIEAGSREKERDERKAKRDENASGHPSDTRCSEQAIRKNARWIDLERGYQPKCHRINYFYSIFWNGTHFPLHLLIYIFPSFFSEPKVYGALEFKFTQIQHAFEYLKENGVFFEYIESV